MDTTFRTPRATRAAGDRGAAAVEFALVLPVLVLFIIGIVEGGTRYAQQSQVNHWAFVAARDVAINPGTNATATARAVVDDFKSPSDTYTVTAAFRSANGSTVASTTCPPAGSVLVTVRGSRTSPTMFGDYTLTGRSVARCEN